jgi:arylsulfatase/arylsulfatase A
MIKITRSCFLLLFLVCSWCVIADESSKKTEAKPQLTHENKRRPNIVIMMTDDQGYGDLGSHGNPFLKTPEIERLAEDGLEMTHFMTYPNCSATRAGMLTGRYPYRTGVTAVTQVDHFMHTDEITIAEVLSDNGYRTGIFGKWHLGDNFPMRPQDQGFSEVLVHKGGGIGQAAGPPGNTYFDPILEHNGESKRYKGYCDDIFTDAALDFISADDDQPFLAYLATNLPHFPLQVPDKLAQPYRDMGLHEDNAKTYGMIASIDYNVGRVLDRLDELGIAENTLVLFFSDNGARDRRTKNDVYPGRWVANLRGTKTSVYDGGIRVPFFVRWPGQIDTEKQTEQMGTVVDIFPTLLDAANIDVPSDIVVDGQSLLPLWRHDEAEGLSDRNFFVQMHYGPTPFKYMHFTVRGKQYKLVSPHPFPHGIVHQPTDQVLNQVVKNLELYDMEVDPSERVNLAKQYPEIVDSMLEEYENWFDEVTEERDARGIQQIIIGDSKAPNINLSRFDWGGPRVISRFDWGGPRVIEDNQLGFWQVRTNEGQYRVSVDLPELDEKGVLHLKYGDLHLTKKVKPGQSRAVFKKVMLPEGEGNFHVYVKSSRLPVGPHFVDINLLDK